MSLSIYLFICLWRLNVFISSNIVVQETFRKYDRPILYCNFNRFTSAGTIILFLSLCFFFNVFDYRHYHNHLIFGVPIYTEHIAALNRLEIKTEKLQQLFKNLQFFIRLSNRNKSAGCWRMTFGRFNDCVVGVWPILRNRPIALRDRLIANLKP